jgi:hypothetical protein
MHAASRQPVAGDPEDVWAAVETDPEAEVIAGDDEPCHDSS